MGRSCQVFGLPGDTTCHRAAAGGFQLGSAKTGQGFPPESRPGRGRGAPPSKPSKFAAVTARAVALPAAG